MLQSFTQSSDIFSVKFLKLAKKILPAETDEKTLARVANRIRAETRFDEFVKLVMYWVEYEALCGDECQDSIDRSLFRDTAIHYAREFLSKIGASIPDAVPFIKPIEKPVIPPKPKLIPIAKEKGSAVKSGSKEKKHERSQSKRRRSGSQKE